MSQEKFVVWAEDNVAFSHSRNKPFLHVHTLLWVVLDWIVIHIKNVLCFQGCISMPRANESGNRMKTAVAHCCIVIIKLNCFRRKHDYQCMECFHPVTFPIWQYPNLVCVIIYISARQKNKLCHTVLPTIYFPFPNQLTSIIRNLNILDKLSS